MTVPRRLRWRQYSLSSLLACMALAALCARPAWQQLQRWQAQGYGWEYWRLSAPRVSPEERQRAAAERGSAWLQQHAADNGDWQTPALASQTQESDL